jgi:hypothetical protein
MHTLTSEIFVCILELAARGEVVISDHGYDELAADGILVRHTMTGRSGTKFIHEGQYAAAVEVEWLESETSWSPYLSLQDAQKLDEVRKALRRGDLQRAGQLARVYQLTPLQV